MATSWSLRGGWDAMDRVGRQARRSSAPGHAVSATGPGPAPGLSLGCRWHAPAGCRCGQSVALPGFRRPTGTRAGRWPHGGRPPSRQVIEALHDAAGEELDIGQLPAPYTLNDVVPAGWQLTTAGCRTDGQSTFAEGLPVAGPSTVSVEHVVINPGQVTRCKFGASRLAPTSTAR